MICFDTEKGRFNFRSVAVIILDDHVLIHRAAADDFWALPGGRVEFFETSEETVEREMFEELGLECSVDRHLWYVENFFKLDVTQFHELANYYLASFEHSPSINSEVDFKGKETSLGLTFRWVLLKSLKKYKLKPEFLSEKLFDLPGSIESIKVNELNV